MQSNGKERDLEATVSAKPKCGIIMPMSDCAQYDAGHWDRVLDIFKEAVSDDFDAELVSVASEVTFIHKTIVQNLGENDLVICDVSSKNPNVMFELGIRLTFDLPTIIVKDEVTDYSFDTSPIEHLPYRKDLRFQDVVDFKTHLRNKCFATLQKKKDDPKYSPFLSHFGTFKVQQLPSTNVDTNEFMLKSLEDVKNELQRVHRLVAKSGDGLVNREFIGTTTSVIVDAQSYDPGQITAAVDLLRVEHPTGFEVSAHPNVS